MTEQEQKLEKINKKRREILRLMQCCNDLGEMFTKTLRATSDLQKDLEELEFGRQFLKDELAIKAMKAFSDIASASNEIGGIFLGLIDIRNESI